MVCVRRHGGYTFELHVEDFEAWHGEITAVYGPSGCGKSTFLDILSLVLTPGSADEFSYCFSAGSCGGETSHSMLLASDSLSATIRAKYLGYVLQSGGLLSFLSAKENIQLPCSLNGLEAEQHVRYLTSSLGLQEHLGKKPQQLSGGQRQRVAIARALAHKPEIVLADEPTAAVDSLIASDIAAEFSSVAKELQTALVLVSHDTELVRTLANRIYTFTLEQISSSHTVSTLRLSPQGL